LRSGGDHWRITRGEAGSHSSKPNFPKAAAFSDALVTELQAALSDISEIGRLGISRRQKHLVALTRQHLHPLGSTNENLYFTRMNISGSKANGK